MLAIGLWYIAFILLIYVSCIFNFLKIILLWEVVYYMLSLVQWKSPYCFYSLHLAKVIYQFINLSMLNQPCLTGINSTWWEWMILMMCCLIWFATISLRNFCSYAHQGHWLIYSFYALFFFFLVLELRQFWPHSLSLEWFKNNWG